MVYARQDLGEAAYQLNLNSGPRMDRHVSVDADGDPRFWFAIDLSIGREHARALAGPPAADVFPALPRPLIAASLRDAMTFFAADDPSGVQVVLAACRAWAWAVDGAWYSKGKAARWAQARLDDPAPVVAAAAREPVPAAGRALVVARADAALSA